MNYLVPILLSFVLSFIFALGGVGAAVVLIPALIWYGIDIALVKPIALMVNTLSLTGASISNIKNKRLDFKLGLPIIVTSAIFAPLGAYISKFISKEIGLIIFIIFLFFSASIMLFFKRGNETKYREDRPLFSFGVVGSIAGFISGLLGVGGGSLISPSLIFLKFNPKKVAIITAFTVPFSSFIGFISYSLMGNINWPLLISCAFAGYVGGVLGTIVMQKYINAKVVKKILAVILVLVGIKMLFKLLG